MESTQEHVSNVYCVFLRLSLDKEKGKGKEKGKEKNKEESRGKSKDKSKEGTSDKSNTKCFFCKEKDCPKENNES